MSQSNKLNIYPAQIIIGGKFKIDSTGIANDTVAGAINIGTGEVARTITIGNTTGATAIVLRAGTGLVTTSGSLSVGNNLLVTATVFSGSLSTNAVFSSFSGRSSFFQSSTTTYLDGPTEVKIRTAASGATELISGTSTRVQVQKPLVVASGAGQYFRVCALTTVEKNALTPANGFVVYDSTLNKFQGYENGAWVSFI